MGTSSKDFRDMPGSWTARTAAPIEGHRALSLLGDTARIAFLQDTREAARTSRQHADDMI
ncbi:hypothetical protein OEZ60_13480 [Defluviimonas sp. WL0024]|uniref:Uncharacterized protein n=1 Tax=Albidovulum salinarum TaxID=2984153 RepID=A0ABT2X511_9RHOB|nr:hypothetical protein [Defluviimonas sp. WL0024]MCU9849014.1 hypothetical protein [Defluviimonas sp. WL0024]